MSNIENDETIRVNIRTGTSTRAPRLRNTESNQLPFEGEITIEFNSVLMNSYPRFLNTGYFYRDENVYDLIARSMYDSQLSRNPNIHLAIRPHNCKSIEVGQHCSVCQDKFKLGESLSTLQDCKHTFHNECLQEWGKYKQECPLCRSAIPILER